MSMENSTDYFAEVTRDYTSNDEIDFEATESFGEDYNHSKLIGRFTLLCYVEFV